MKRTSITKRKGILVLLIVLGLLTQSIFPAIALDESADTAEAVVLLEETPAEQEEANQALPLLTPENDMELSQDPEIQPEPQYREELPVSDGQDSSLEPDPDPVPEQGTSDSTQTPDESLNTKDDQKPADRPDTDQEPENGEEAQNPEDNQPEDSTEEPGEENPGEEDEAEDKEEDKEEKPTTDEMAALTPAKPSTLSSDLPNLGTALVQVAREAYEKYRDTACWEQFRQEGSDSAWSDDFVFWCAQQLALTGVDECFGEESPNVPELLRNIIDAEALVYYPGEQQPRPGDLVVWWYSSQVGTPESQWNYEDAVSMGIVTEAGQETVTLLQGDLWGSDPQKSSIQKLSCKITEPAAENAAILLLLRPQYPEILDAENKSLIQDTLLDILYGGGGGYLSCEFDGYTSTDGRHEGIDFTYYPGANVYSLTDGEITRIYSGVAGSLSTISIYDPANNRTVVYLHANPSPDIHAGQSVKRGDLIATEGSRGASAAHTHVEVVNGPAYYANVSVGDNTLENEEPYLYWATVLCDAYVQDAVYYRNSDDSDISAPANPLPESFLGSLADQQETPDEVTITEPFDFSLEYLGEADSRYTVRFADTELRYRAVFEAKRRFQPGEVAIGLDAGLFTTEDGTVILPDAVSVPVGVMDRQGNLLSYTQQQGTAFNYVLTRDDSGKEIVLLRNYQTIEAGSVETIEIGYSSVPCGNTGLGHTWEIGSVAVAAGDDGYSVYDTRETDQNLTGYAIPKQALRLYQTMYKRWGG